MSTSIKNCHVCVKHSHQMKLFLGGLPTESKLEDLEQIISRFAEVSKIELKMRANNKKCLGYGLITASTTQAKKLISLGQIDYRNRKVKITPYREGNELKSFRKELGKRRLFIKNIPKNANSRAISRYFTRYGAVESCYLRGEPSSDLKIAVLIFKNKASALSVYKDFRFGLIDFNRILSSNNLKEKVMMGFQFSDFNDQRKKKGGNSNYHGYSTAQSTPKFKENNKGAYGFWKKKFSKILADCRPGDKGFDYSSNRQRQYVFNLSTAKRNLMALDQGTKRFSGYHC